MRRVLGFLIGFNLSLAVWGAVHFAPAARAQSYVRNGSTDPAISLTLPGLLSFWSGQAAARSVTTDAQWNSAMQTVFSTTAFPGVDPTSLAFLRSFFVQVVHVGVP